MLVPERVILYPEHLTREDWLGECNSEVRRVIQECWGHNRLVELIGDIGQDQSARGELIAVDIFNDPERCGPLRPRQGWLNGASILK